MTTSGLTWQHRRDALAIDPIGWDLGSQQQGTSTPPAGRVIMPSERWVVASTPSRRDRMQSGQNFRSHPPQVDPETTDRPGVAGAIRSDPGRSLPDIAPESSSDLDRDPVENLTPEPGQSKSVVYDMHSRVVEPVEHHRQPARGEESRQVS